MEKVETDDKDRPKVCCCVVSLAPPFLGPAGTSPHTQETMKITATSVFGDPYEEVDTKVRNFPN